MVVIESDRNSNIVGMLSAVCISRNKTIYPKCGAEFHIYIAQNRLMLSRISHYNHSHIVNKSERKKTFSSLFDKETQTLSHTHTHIRRSVCNQNEPKQR